MIAELNVDEELGRLTLQAALKFHRLRLADPDEASRVADAARVVFAVWVAGERTVACLPARGADLLERGEDSSDAIWLLVDDEHEARYLAGAPAH